MKKSLLAALVLGATFSMTGCDDSKTSQHVEQAKASVSEAKDAVVNAAKDMKNSTTDAVKDAQAVAAEKMDAMAAKAGEMKEAAAE